MPNNITGNSSQTSLNLNLTFKCHIHVITVIICFLQARITLKHKFEPNEIVSRQELL